MNLLKSMIKSINDKPSIVETKKVKYRMSDIFNSKIPINDDLIKFTNGIGISYLMKMFVKIPNACIEINEHLNNYESYTIDYGVVIDYFRYIVSKYNINIYKDLFYTKRKKLNKKEKECINVLTKEFPEIPYNELKNELINYEDTDELYNYLFPSKHKTKEKTNKEILTDTTNKIENDKNCNIKNDIYKIINKFKNCDDCKCENCNKFNIDINTNNELDVLFINDIHNYQDGFDNESFMNIKNMLNKNDLKYIFTDLISSSDRKRFSKRIADKCSKHINYILNTYNPKLVVLIGDDTGKYILNNKDIKFYNLDGKVITDENGRPYVGYMEFRKVFKNYDKYKYHYNHVTKVIKDLLTDEKKDNGVSADGIDFSKINLNTKGKNPFINCFDNNIIKDRGWINITQPDKNSNKLFHKISKNIYYDDDFYLIDVLNQYGMFGKYTYIFKNKNEPDKKYYVDCNINEIYLYYGEKELDKEIIYPLEKLNPAVVNKDDYKNIRVDLDLQPNNKYTYYDTPRKYTSKLHRDYDSLKKDFDIESNILFFDIETYFNGPNDEIYNQSVSRGRQKKIDTLDMPINALTLMHYNGIKDKYEKYCLYWHLTDDEELEYKEFDNVKIIRCENEKDLLEKFLIMLHHFNPEIITGWNVYYDIGTVYTRLRYLGYEDYLSPFNKVEHIPEDREVKIYGYEVIDLITVFKAYIPKRQPMHNLDFISNKFLNESKEEYKGKLTDLYENDINTFVKYNIKDVDLLIKLHEKLAHLTIANELRGLTKASFKKACYNKMSTIIPSYMSNYFYNEHNFVMRNGFSDKLKEKYKGAYVKEPISGLSEWVIDLDYKSLYPSIMRTYNLGVETLCASISMKDAHDYIYRKDRLKDKTIEISYFKDETEGKLNINELDKYLDNKFITISGSIFYKHTVKKSSLYLTMTELVNKRDEYKGMRNKTKESDSMYSKLDRKQLVYKQLANSFYGLLGTESYEYYMKAVAETITLIGQETIKFATSATNYIMDSAEDVGIDNINHSMEHILNKTDYMNPIIHGNIIDPVDSDVVIYTDTDSIFITLSKLVNNLNMNSKDDIVNYITDKLVPKLEECINRSILNNFYLKTHDLNSEFFYLKLKQEWISRRVFTNGKKKKYALYLINKEGKPTDEIEVKGIEIIRSDYSEFSRDKLESMLPMILKPEVINIPSIIKYIEDVAEEYRTLCRNRDLSVFRTVPYTKPFEDYLSTNSNALSIKFWNDIMNDKSKLIKMFDKAYLVYLKDIDFTKMKEHEDFSFENYNKLLSEFDKFQTDNVIKYISISPEYHGIPDLFIPDEDIATYKGWYKIVERLFGFITNVTYKDPEESKTRLSRKVMNTDNNIGKINNKFLI